MSKKLLISGQRCALIDDLNCSAKLKSGLVDGWLMGTVIGMLIALVRIGVEVYRRKKLSSNTQNENVKADEGPGPETAHKTVEKSIRELCWSYFDHALTMGFYLAVFSPLFTVYQIL